MLSRREIIKLGLQGTVLSALYPYEKLLAQARQPHYLVVIRLPGGYHPPLSFDPLSLAELRDRSIDPIKNIIETQSPTDMSFPIGQLDFYAAYKESEILKAGSLKLGPSAHVLAKHADDIAILNGLVMTPGDTIHEPNRLFMTKGVKDVAAPHFIMSLAQKLGGSPLGVISHTNYDAPKGSVPTTPVASLSSNATLKIDEILVQAMVSMEDSSRARTMRDSYRAALEFVKYSSQFGTWMKEYVQLADNKQLFLKDTVPEGGRPFGPRNVFPTLAATFSSGLARFAQIDFQTDPRPLDTHTNHATHKDNLRACLAYLSDVFDFFKNVPSTFARGAERSLFEDTTFIVIGEFGRTADIQNGNGTDHNPLINSVLFAGKRIRGGAQVGASTVISRNATTDNKPILQGLPFNFGSDRALTFDEYVHGQLKDDGKMFAYGKCKGLIPGDVGQSACIDFLQPMHVWKTIAAAFDVNHGVGYIQNVSTINALLKS